MFSDYIKQRTLDYFDIFPIHHYQILRRKVFGQVAMRPISSPYFEMIAKRKAKSRAKASDK